MATAEAEVMDRMLTAQEFLMQPDDGVIKELVRGRIVTMNVPAPRHGYYCLRISRFIAAFAEDEKDLGRAVSNDSGVVTEHDPDTVRGPDISYYSYKRLPKGPLPEGYLDVAPDAAIEVRSPSDSWRKIFVRVIELLDADVLAVCIVDPRTESITAFDYDGPPRVFYKGDTFTLPGILPGFELPLTRLFE